MIINPDILFVVNDFGFLRSHRLELLLSLEKQGKSIVVITNLHNSNEQELNKLRQKNISFINFTFDRSTVNPFLNFLYLVRLFKLLLRIKPKKVSFISAKPVIFGGICSLFLNLDRSYFSITGMGYAFISTSIKARLIKFIIFLIYRIIFKPKNATVIFQNNDDRDFFIKKKVVDFNKTVLIRGNGIDIKRFARISYPDNLVFLFASRLLVDKGIREFMHCADDLATEGVSFKVAGPRDATNPNNISDELYNSLLNNKNIDYLGPIAHEKMQSVFNQSSVFVLPSYREGLPQVALEAASCEMPLILNNVTGCKDCLVEAESGFLTKKNDVDDLKEKMNFFIKDRSLVMKMGLKSRDFIISNFSQEKILPQFLNLYKNK